MNEDWRQQAIERRLSNAEHEIHTLRDAANALQVRVSVLESGAAIGRWLAPIVVAIAAIVASIVVR